MRSMLTFSWQLKNAAAVNQWKTTDDFTHFDSRPQPNLFIGLSVPAGCEVVELEDSGFLDVEEALSLNGGGKTRAELMQKRRKLQDESSSSLLGSIPASAEPIGISIVESLGSQSASGKLASLMSSVRRPC